MQDLKDGLLLLDGGMGLELAKRGTHDNHGLWSAQALIDAPDVVVDVHKEFIAAGARLIITNSYSTIPSYLDKSDLADRYVELTALAGELARKAADESGLPVTVAGSLPPLSESYRPDLVPPEEEAAPIYEHIVSALRNYVDVYFCETMSTGQEALTAASSAVRHGEDKPVYVSWTLDETPGQGLRSGEPIAQALAKLEHLPIEGFLFNCTHPEAVIDGIRTLRSLTAKPVGGYANRLNRIPMGHTVDNEVVAGQRLDLSVEDFVSAGLSCIDEGALMIGGCCGIGPEHIDALRKAIKFKGHRLLGHG